MLVNVSVLRQIKEMDIESYSVVQIKKPTTTAAVSLKMCVRDYKAIWSLFRRSSYPTNLAAVTEVLYRTAGTGREKQYGALYCKV